MISDYIKSVLKFICDSKMIDDQCVSSKMENGISDITRKIDSVYTISA